MRETPQLKQLLVPLALCLALAGCTSAPESGAEAGEKGFEISVPTASAAPAATETVNPGLSEVKCAADKKGSWSFEGVLKNDSEKNRAYTVAIAVAVGNRVEGHELIAKSVPAGGVATIAAANFATSTDPAAVCAPVTSITE